MPFLIKNIDTFLHIETALLHSYKIFCFGNAFLKSRAGPIPGASHFCNMTISRSHFTYYMINVGCVGMKTVVAYFVFGVQNDQHTTGKPNSQPGNIYDGIYLILPQIPPRGFKIIFYHDYFFIRFSMTLPDSQRQRLSPGSLP